MVQFGPYNPIPVAKEEPRLQLRRPRKSGRSSGRMAIFAAVTIGTLVCSGYFLFFHSGSAEIVAVKDGSAAPSRSSAVGQILMSDGVNCRKKEFDSVTGILKDVSTKPCEGSRAQPDGGPQYQYPDNRLDMVRKSFLRQ